MKTPFKSICSAVLAMALVLPSGAGAQEAAILNLPAPGQMVNTSPAFIPAQFKGMVVYPQEPFRFDFIVDAGESGLSTEGIKRESDRLIKYFLAALTIPENDIWVNLSPYEKQRIIPEALGQTELGRDLLAQDYVLKQFSATLIDPQKDLGKEFWKRVYAQAREKFGNTEVPVNTFNKVWILPDEAGVFERNNAVYITRSTLRVLADEDYLALRKNSSNVDMPAQEETGSHSVSSQIVKEILIPEITKEVNTGKNFALLRQVYSALILAKWYKEALKDSLLSQLYQDQNKIKGVDLNDPTVKEKIYAQYLQAYKKGVFNYIKEEADLSGQFIPRKYFSGGLEPMAMTLVKDRAMNAVDMESNQLFLVNGSMASVRRSDAVMTIADKKKADTLGALIAVPEHGGFFDMSGAINQLDFLNFISADLGASKEFGLSFRRNFDTIRKDAWKFLKGDLDQSGKEFQALGFSGGEAGNILEALYNNGYIEEDLAREIRASDKILQAADLKAVFPAFTDEQSGKIAEVLNMSARAKNGTYDLRRLNDHYQRYLDLLKEAQAKLPELKQSLEALQNEKYAADAIEAIDKIQGISAVLVKVLEPPVGGQLIRQDLAKIFGENPKEYVFESKERQPPEGRQWLPYKPEFLFSGTPMPVMVDEELVRLIIGRSVENVEDVFNQAEWSETDQPKTTRIFRISDEQIDGKYALVVTNSGKLPNEMVDEVRINLQDGVLVKQGIHDLKQDRRKLFEGGIGSNFQYSGMEALGGQVRIENAVENGVPVVRTIFLFSPADAAMNSPSDVGGIDLNKIGVARQGEKIQFTVDSAQAAQMLREGVEGFRPVIINVIPLASPMPLFGLSASDTEEQLAKNQKVI